MVLGWNMVKRSIKVFLEEVQFSGEGVPLQDLVDCHASADHYRHVSADLPNGTILPRRDSHQQSQRNDHLPSSVPTLHQPSIRPLAFLLHLSFLSLRVSLKQIPHAFIITNINSPLISHPIIYISLSAHLILPSSLSKS